MVLISEYCKGVLFIPMWDQKKIKNFKNQKLRNCLKKRKKVCGEAIVNQTIVKWYFT